MTVAKTGAKASKAAETVDPNLVVVELDSLTCGEIEYFEDETGNPIAHYFEAGTPQGKALRVLGFLVKLREDKAFTYEESANLRVGVRAVSPVPPVESSD